jgi:hypothetical protein
LHESGPAWSPHPEINYEQPSTALQTCSENALVYGGFRMFPRPSPESCSHAQQQQQLEISMLSTPELPAQPAPTSQLPNFPSPKCTGWSPATRKGHGAGHGLDGSAASLNLAAAFGRLRSAHGSD